VAESKSITVNFEGNAYVAFRPEVLPVLKRIHEANWCRWLEFRGTEAELISAGVARAEMFDIGKSVQRKYEDEYGDHCTVYRRGAEKWEIEYAVRVEGNGALPSDEHPGRCRWWVKWGGEAEAVTAEILRRFTRSAARP
jgi:hypothetical protein